MTRHNLYCCYSVNLRKYLSSVGISYEICALNPNSKTMFWVYLRNDALNEALDNWSNKF